MVVAVGPDPDGVVGEVGDVEPPEFGRVEPEASGVEDVDAGAEGGAAVVSAVGAVLDGVVGGLLAFCEEPQPARTVAATRTTYHRRRITAPLPGLCPSVAPRHILAGGGSIVHGGFPFCP